jgi:hypothetical protein
MGNKNESDIPPIVFSFKYYDNNEKWCISCWKKDEIKTALKRFQEINNNQVPILKIGKTWHFHPIRWEETIYPKGFTNPLLNEMEAWQIALPSVKKSLTRVYGVIQQNIFYIVWFDLNHDICPTTLKNT